MKMKTVIEAGRKAAPLVNEGLSETQAKLKDLRQLLSDMSAMKSESGMKAVLGECVRSLDSISGSLVDVTGKWSDFDEVLKGYRYRFRKGKPQVSKDLPGQQVMEFGKN